MKLVATSNPPNDEGPISVVAQPFVGAFEWLEDSLVEEAAAFFDFASLTLEDDGTFHAMVEAVLVNPAVRTFGARCTLPESGVWNAYTVGDRVKVRLRPTTGRARVYEGSIETHGTLILARRGGRAVLAKILTRHGLGSASALECA